MKSTKAMCRFIIGDMAWQFFGWRWLLAGKWRHLISYFRFDASAAGCCSLHHIALHMCALIKSIGGRIAQCCLLLRSLLSYIIERWHLIEWMRLERWFCVFCSRDEGENCVDYRGWRPVFLNEMAGQFESIHGDFISLGPWSWVMGKNNCRNYLQSVCWKEEAALNR